MRILVCGGRDFTNWELLNDKLYWICFEISDGAKETTIISGGAKGADSLGIKWAQDYGTLLEIYNADWKKYPRTAGLIRNQQMLDEGKPDLVVAFPGGNGTAHMVKIAKAKGVKVIEVEYDRTSS